MINRLRHVLRLAALGLMFSVPPAQAQDWPDLLETKQLFRVVVTGMSQAGIKLHPVKGTAWAIAPDVLITADHVTGDKYNFQNRDSSGKVFIPFRDVSVEVSATKVFDGDDPKTFPGGIVTPSPFESIDAARIGYPALGAKPFALSACEIVSGNFYRVLKFNDGNVFQPKTVPITLKAYGRSVLGDAGSVVVMSVSKGTIVESDSGSPVLDAGNENRVIGLVSAINDDTGSEVLDEVHVTLVRSFLDLIPLQLGQTEFLDIPCSERERLQQVDALQAGLGTAQESIEALRGEKEVLQSRLDVLESRNTSLMRQVNALLWNQVSLARDAERATGKKFDPPSAWDLLQPFDKNAVMFEEYQKEIAKPIDEPPLRPTVTRISSALGNPKWDLRGSINTNQDVTITLSYERTLSGPPHSLDMYFCFRPIFWDVPGDAPVRDNPTNAKYYEKYDGPFEEESGRLDAKECERVSHTARNASGMDPNSITKGYYTWEGPGSVIRRLKSFHDEVYPQKEWTGVYYLQVFEPMDTPDSDKGLYRLHAKAIIDVLRDEGEATAGSALPCRVFEASPAKSGDLGPLASGEQKLEEDEVCAQDI